MKSLRCLYRIGHGPSSSHTIGPQKASEYILEKYKNIKSVDVTLYGSLAFTGKGHMTDKIIISTFKDYECNVKFDINTQMEHPNTMVFKVTLDNGNIETKKIFSVGGGAIKIEGEVYTEDTEVYPEKNFEEVASFCKKHNYSLADYVRHYEGDEIFVFLHEIWDQMKSTINNGLRKEGVLPGKLGVKRKAYRFLSEQNNILKKSRVHRLVSAYAFSTGEENASGEVVVTCPTCGAAATMPAVLKFLQDGMAFSDDYICEAIAVAGVIGNLIKQNGSISGAEAGCQAEIGSACSMAAAAVSYLNGFNIDQIECAAEIAMEHSLGSTCDPVGGYVIIPCIERNAVAAIRAIESATIAEYSADSHSISFDTIIKTMLQTGHDMNKDYRETSIGGLAKEIGGKYEN